MQVLDTAEIKVDKDQNKKAESLAQKGQRIFLHNSAKHTNSATGENESPVRQVDNDPQAAVKSEEERLRLRNSLMSQ
jgi:hypothetical protein